MSALSSLGCSWDAEHRLFTGRRGPVRLSRGEVTVLQVLVDADGGVVPRDRIAVAARPDFAIRRLRDKIEEDPSDPRIVLTVHGVGYRLASPVDVPEPKPASLVVLGRAEVDLGVGVVRRDGDEHGLTALQLGVLRALLEADGATVDRQTLFRTVWRRRDQRDRLVDGVVRQLRARIESDPDDPRILRTVDGGYALVRRTSTNLGAELVPLVGRRSELDEVLEACGQPGVVVLVGPPGIGKSRLAEAACRRLADRLQGGAWWVDCAARRSPSEVARAVGEALGVRDRTDAESLQRVIARRPATSVVLDNVEHLTELDALAVRLAKAGAHVLATSTRELPVGRHVRLGPLPLDDARELYLRTAARAGRSTDDDHLLAALDGSPLAIVLAARRVGLLDVDAVRLRPHESLRSAGDASRHGSVERAFEGSFALLPARLKDVLRGLTVFRGPFDPPSAAAVAGAGLDDLDELTRRSFVERTVARGVEGLRVHGLFARLLRARDLGPRAEQVERWLAWAQDRAAALSGVPDLPVWAEVDRISTDLLDAAEALLPTDPQSAARILEAAGPWLPASRALPLTAALADDPRPFPLRTPLRATHLVWTARGRPDALARLDALIAEDPAFGGTWAATEARWNLLTGGTLPEPGPPPPPPDDLMWASFAATRWSQTGRVPEALALLDGAARRAIREGRLIGQYLEGWRLHLRSAFGYPAAELGDPLERCARLLRERGSLSRAGTVADWAAIQRAYQGRRSSAESLLDLVSEVADLEQEVVLELRGRVTRHLTRLDDDPERAVLDASELAANAVVVGDQSSLGTATVFEAIHRARLGDVDGVRALLDRVRRPALDAVVALVDPSAPVPDLPSSVAGSWRVIPFARAARLGERPPRWMEREMASNPLLRALSEIVPAER